MRTGLLVADDAGVRFRHELTRRVVEDALFVPRRRALHRQILAVLEGRASVDPARLAHHARSAGDAAAILRHAVAAGRSAAAARSHREAAAQLGAALEHAGLLDERARAGLLEMFAMEAHLTDRTRESLAAIEEAARLWQALGDRRAAGASLARQAEVQWRSGDQAGGLKAAQTAVGILEGLDPGPELAMAYGMVAGLSNMSDAYIEGRAWGERAADLARKLGSDAALAFALVQVGVATADDDPDAGTAMLLAAHRLADGAGRDDVAALALTFRARAWVYRYRADQAEPALAEALAYADAHEVSAYRQYLLALRAQSLARPRPVGGRRAGRPRGARRRATSPASSPRPRCSPSARCRPGAGTRTRTRRWRRRGDGRSGRAASSASAPTAAARVEHAWLAGDRTAARALAADGFRRVADDRRAVDHRRAGVLVRAARRPGRARPAPVAEPYAALLGEDWPTAAIYWEKQGLPYRHALALRPSGDPDAVVRALAIADRLGATRAGGTAARAAARPGRHPRCRAARSRDPRQPRRPHHPPGRGAHARGRGPDQRRDRRPAGGVDPHRRPPRGGRAVPARRRLPAGGGPPRRPSWASLPR